jgi:hypothetical protein
LLLDCVATAGSCRTGRGEETGWVDVIVTSGHGRALLTGAITADAVVTSPAFPAIPVRGATPSFFSTNVGAIPPLDGWTWPSITWSSASVTRPSACWRTVSASGRP